MKNRSDEPAHYLCAGVTARTAVRFAVDDERVVRAVDQSDAALATIDVPHERPPRGVDPVAQTIDRCLRLRSAGSDSGVTPNGRRAECEYTDDRRGCDDC